MYLNRNKVLSYNASLNFIVLKRGYGKSWTFKDYIINEYIKSGYQSIWARRYKNELKETMAGFLDDISDNYKEHKLELKNKAIYIDGKPAIFFYTINQSKDIKSAPKPKVRYLIFDEFIIEGGNTYYLPAECTVFSSFMSSVFRDRTMRVYLLGNKVKTVTPYNIYFRLPDFNCTKYDAERRILVYATDGDGVIEDNYAKSDLEKVLRGTEYYDYSFLNTSLNDNNAFVEKRPSELKTSFVFNINGIVVGLFFDTEHSKLYFDLKCDKTIHAKYSLNKENMAESYMLLSKQFPMSRMIKDAYLQGRVYFNDIRTKTVVQELLDYIV